MKKYVISIAFFICSVNAQNVEERYIIENKTKVYISNQVYNNGSKSFINKNFNKYKNSVFKIIPEMR